MNEASPLIGQYRTAINRIELAYASVVLWSYPDTPAAFDDIYDAMSDEVKIFPNVKRLVHDETTMKIATDDLYMNAYRSALTDLLPLTKLYCHETGQLAMLKSQPWFTFWRILRNCFAHDLVFNFNPTEKALLPVTWNGVTINESMNRKPLTHGQMSYAKMLELLETAKRFLLSDVA